MTNNGKAKLSDRERAVVCGIVSGKTYAEIAATLDLGFETVRTHAARIRRKLGMNKVGIAAWAARQRGLCRDN